MVYIQFLNKLGKYASNYVYTKDIVQINKHVLWYFGINHV